jgi:threonylcarbamoyladenosine tRNA methylthiotransferase MtaB
MDDDLWRLIGDEERLLPHLHMSLQAGDDLILKRMKRRHLRDDAIAFASRARELRPGIAFGADLIVGFPTETEAHFENTLKIVDECDLTFLHVFPYSPRPGTPAARMPQVNGAVIKERAKRLREKATAAELKHFQEMQGKPVRALVEGFDGDEAFGKTDHFAPVRFETKGGNLQAGSVVTLNITNHTNKTLLGERI